MDSYSRKARLLFLPLLFLLLVSCTRQERQVVRSYYYWKASTGLEREEARFLKQHRVQKLYTRLLDVDWDEVQGAVPVASVGVDELIYSMRTYDSIDIEVVPVVFLTNKTFQRIDSVQIPQLAKRVVRRCLPSYDEVDKAYERGHRSYQIERPLLRPREIQFDCDWTAATAKKYFYFLQVVKALFPPGDVKLSATIRLHQYKYPSKTGVPSVDRGMLMVYNINDLRQHTPVNSIFDYDRASAYFTAFQKYPLPLDMALPAFSWGVVFRNGRFYQLENSLTEEELKQCTFLEETAHQFYRVKSDTVYRDLFLRPGDEIKLEKIDEQALRQAAQLSRKAVNTDSFHVALFELSATEIKSYSHEAIEEVYSSYR